MDHSFPGLREAASERRGNTFVSKGFSPWSQGQKLAGTVLCETYLQDCGKRRRFVPGVNAIRDSTVPGKQGKVLWCQERWDACLHDDTGGGSSHSHSHSTLTLTLNTHSQHSHVHSHSHSHSHTLTHTQHSHTTLTPNTHTCTHTDTDTHSTLTLNNHTLSVH